MEIFYVVLIMWQHIHEDTDMNATEAIGMGLHSRGISEEDITMEMVPGTFYNPGGVSYWKPDPEETADIVEELFGEKMPEVL